MKVITPDIGIKNVKIMPRESNFDTLYLYDESENISYTFTITDITDGEYYVNLQFETDVELTNQRFYMMTLTNVDGLVFRDKIFVTSQAVSDFNVNNDPSGNSIYKQNQSNNEYIIWE